MESNMVRETKKAKFLPSVWLEALIFILLFIIAQLIQGVIVTAISIIDMFSKIAQDIYTLEDFTDVSFVISELYSNSVFLIASLFSTIILIAVVILYCKTIQKRSLASIGIVKKKLFRNYILGILWGLLFSGIIYSLLFITGNIEGVKFNGLSIIVLVLMFGFMIQSASEEIFARGYFMNSVTAKSNVILGIILNSVFFMALHLFNMGLSLISLLNLALYGVIFSLLCYLSDDIWMVSGMHFSWNFALGCIYGGNVSGIPVASIFTIELKGSDIMTGSDFGIEGSILTTIVGILIILLLSLLLTQKNKSDKIKFDKTIA